MGQCDNQYQLSHISLKMVYSCVCFQRHSSLAAKHDYAQQHC